MRPGAKKISSEQLGMEDKRREAAEKLGRVRTQVHPVGRFRGATA